MIKKTTLEKIAKFGVSVGLAGMIALHPKPSNQTPLPEPKDKIAAKYIEWEAYHVPNMRDTTYNTNIASTVDKYFSHKQKLQYHTNTIKEFAQFYGQFDMKYSDTEKLTQFGLAQASIESNFQHTNDTSGVLTSRAHAKGVFQFLEVALEDLNQKLSYLQERDSSFNTIDSFDVALAHEPSPAGARENIRAGMFSLMNGLESHRGDWQWHVARYNYGSGNLQNAGITKRNLRQKTAQLPKETINYLTYMATRTWLNGDSAEMYTNQRMNNYINNLYYTELKDVRNKKNSIEERQDKLSALLELNKVLAHEGKDENKFVGNHIARTHFYQAELNREMGLNLFAKQHYKLAVEHSDSKFWVNRNAAYRLKTLKNKS